MPSLSYVALMHTQESQEVKWKANFFFIWILNFLNIFIFFTNFVLSEKVKDFRKYSGILLMVREKCKH